RCVVLLFRPTARARSAIPSTGLFSVKDDRIVSPRSSDWENAADGAAAVSRAEGSLADGSRADGLRADGTPRLGAACAASVDLLRGMGHDSRRCFNCSNAMLTSRTEPQYRSPHSDCSVSDSGGIQ